MDPRIHRRRVEVRRQEGLHRLLVLVGITVVAVLAAAGWAATGTALLDVDRIVVDGAVHTQPADATAAAGLHRGEPLVDVDVHAADRAVERLPWVARARVTRRWPNQVHVDIVERRAAAVAASATDARFVLVDASGRVLERIDSPPSGMALLAGLPPAGDPGSTLSADGVAALSVALAMPAELRSRTAEITPVGGSKGEVELHLSTDGTVRLGPPDDLDRKFDAVRAVLAQVDLRNLATLDVRRPDSPVLTRRDATAKVSTPRAG